MEVRARLGLLLLACGYLACSQAAEPRTELIVVVDSDLEAPTELDELVVFTRGPGTTEREANANLGPEQPDLPRNLGLSYEKGPLGPFLVTVEGRKDGAIVLQREAEVSFVSGQSLVLPLHLVRACVDTLCEEGESCTERGCESIEVDAGSLSEWTGTKPTLHGRPVSEPDAGGDAEAPEDAGLSEDAGGEQDAASEEGGVGIDDAGAASDAGSNSDAGSKSDAGGQCIPAPELCNGRDDNCDGNVDEGFDLQTDVNNCGRCGNRCNRGRGDMCCMGTCSRGC